MTTAVLLVAALALGIGTWAFWRYWWFWRNPPRRIPEGDDIVCPADGVVVYAKEIEVDEPVISIKKGLAASVTDIAREHVGEPKILIGVFMSPVDVHHNRAPIAGALEATRQYPAQGRNHYMGAMQLRTLLGLHPMSKGSPHIIENNRAVTRFGGTLAGEPAWAYVVQIGSRGVSGIDVYPKPGEPCPFRQPRLPRA